MSIESLKQELAVLDATKRAQIMAFLVSLQDDADGDYRAKLARKIDDHDPSHWADLDEFDRRLAKKKS
jgi:hypothetical protein